MTTNRRGKRQTRQHSNSSVTATICDRINRQFALDSPWRRTQRKQWVRKLEEGKVGVLEPQGAMSTVQVMGQSVQMVQCHSSHSHCASNTVWATPMMFPKLCRVLSNNIFLYRRLGEPSLAIDGVRQDLESQILKQEPRCSVTKLSK